MQQQYHLSVLVCVQHLQGQMHERTINPVDINPLSFNHSLNLTLSATVETRSVGVNTPGLPVHDNSTSVNVYSWEEPSRLSRASGGYSLLLGNEEEELQAMLRELLAAFPTQTKKSKCIVFLFMSCSAFP